MKPIKVIILFICLGHLSFAQVPGTLSYQGILMQSDGITPLTDGAHSIVFSFYNVGSGGSALFTRTISVTTSRGLYTCIIGGGTGANAQFNATQMNQIGSQQVFIGMTVDGGSELSPRAQLTTNPYSLRAESITNTANPTGGNVSFWGANNTMSWDVGLFWDNSNKRLGIGTATPVGLLDIKGTIGNLRVFDYTLQFTRPGTNYFHATSPGGKFFFTVNGNVDTNPTMVVDNTGVSVNGGLSSTGGIVGTGLSTGNHYILGSLSPTSAEGAPGSESAITIRRNGTGGVKNSNTAEIKVSTWESGISGRTSMEFWLSGLPNNENSFGSFGEVPVLVLHGDDLGGTSNQGRVGIGTLATSATLSVNGDANKIGGGTWGVFSDQRLKSDIRPFNDGLNVLMRIKPKYFKYNGLGAFKASEHDEIGIIAQEIQPIAPYMITEVYQKLTKEDKEETGLLIYDGGSSLIYVMVNAIKEQQTQIEELKSANKNLEKRIASLERNENKSVAKQLTASKSEK